MLQKAPNQNPNPKAHDPQLAPPNGVCRIEGAVTLPNQGPRAGRGGGGCSLRGRPLTALGVLLGSGPACIGSPVLMPSELLPRSPTSLVIGGLGSVVAGQMMFTEKKGSKQMPCVGG